MKLFLGVLTLAFILAANLQYVFSGYGIRTASTLHLNVLAQTSNGTNGGGTTSDGTNGGGTTSGGTTSGSTNGTFTGNFCGDINYVPDSYMVPRIETVKVTSNEKGVVYILGKPFAGYKKSAECSVTVAINDCSGRRDGACCDQRLISVEPIIH